MSFVGSVFLAGSSLAAEAATVTLSVGQNIQAAIDANPAGTEYVLKAGIHRMQTVAPKTGDTIAGEAGAILSGAKVLTGWIQSGSLWYVTGQTQQGASGGACFDTHPRCTYPEEVYFNNVLKYHEDNLSEVGPGEWFFDYAADRIYVGDNPMSATVETSVTPRALVAGGNTVTIRNLIIEKYTDIGIGGGNQWIIQDSEIRYVHNTGIWNNIGDIVRRNFIHHNGCQAFGGAGANITIENNEISYNNTAGNNSFNGCGGSKWVWTDHLIVRGNFSHHNDGPGLWTDINNINTLYEDNTVEDNARGGIFHEISYAAVIRNNVIRRNGTLRILPDWSTGAGIEIVDSPNVEVYGNTVVDNWQGITCLDDGRRDPGAPHGPWEMANMYVHDNTVVQTADNGYPGHTGCIDAYYSNNQYVNNTYYLGTSPIYFIWDTYKNETQWVAAGQDITGRFYRNTPYPGGGTPPLNISGVSASTIYVSSATIVWTTDKAADSQVEYGLTAAYGQTTSVNSALVTSHAQGLTGLSANTLYHFRVKSKEASGSAVQSNDFSFTTAFTGSPAFTGTPAVIPGKIEAENFNNGAQGVAYNDLDAANNGGQFRSSGVDIKDALNDAGGYAIGWIQSGEWLAYLVQVDKTSTYSFGARVGSAVATGIFHIEVDGTDKTGPIGVPNTGDYAAWQTVVKTGVALTAGQHVLKIVADAQYFDLNYLSVLEMCDVNQDARTDVIDIQQAVNQALGSAPWTFDLNGNGTCDVVDVQRVVNASVGGACTSP